MSSPPYRSTGRATTSSTPLREARSAVTASTCPSARAAARSSAAASVSRASFLAQMATRHPSSTKAAALARPRPRLEPVTIATLSVRLRFMVAADRGERPLAGLGRLPSAASGEIVQRPVERPKHHHELISGQELLLGGQEPGFDQSEHGALDGATRGKCVGGSVPVRGDKLLRPP